MRHKKSRRQWRRLFLFLESYYVLLNLILCQHTTKAGVLDRLVRVAELGTVVAGKDGVTFVAPADATFVVRLRAARPTLGARSFHDVGHG